MAGSGRGASASWLPVLMATCGVPETRRPSCLLQQRSFNWCQFCGPAVRSESPARESPAAPAWGSPGGRHWLVGGAAGNELVSNGSSLLHELSLPPAGQPGWVSRPLHPRWVTGPQAASWRPDCELTRRRFHCLLLVTASRKASSGSGNVGINSTS